jgi:hypothetical protein
MRRYLLLRRTLAQMGVEPRRVRLVWASAAEGVKLAQEINSLVEEIRALGPLQWNSDQLSVTSEQLTDPSLVTGHSPEEVAA